LKETIKNSKGGFLKMKKKKFLATLLTAAMTAALLAGCGNDAGSQGDASQGDASQSGAAEGASQDGGSENASGGGSFR
jgi:hypothetical protein